MLYTADTFGPVFLCESTILRAYMSAPQRPSSTAAPLDAGPLRLVDAAFRNVAIPYHTVPFEQLYAITSRKLVESGVPADALGRCTGTRITLSGCVSLTPFARAHVPPALGGDAG